MGPFLRGFCSELTKTADETESVNPAYGYNAKGDSPSPSPILSSLKNPAPGKPFFYRDEKAPYRPSPKPPAPVDNRAPIDPYPKAKAAPAKPKKPERMGFPDIVDRSNKAPKTEYTEDKKDKTGRTKEDWDKLISGGPGGEGVAGRDARVPIAPTWWQKDLMEKNKPKVTPPPSTPLNTPAGQFAQMPTDPDKGK